MKGKRFKGYRYVGDPINAVKIFNEKEVDELVLIDVKSTSACSGINFSLIDDIVSEAFMPVAYGGGVSSLDDIKRIFRIGVEKIILNSSAFSNPALVREAVKLFGSQSICVSVDVKKTWLGAYQVYTKAGQNKIAGTLDDHLRKLEDLGVGEFIVGNIDNEGQKNGYDLQLVKQVSDVVSRPVVATHGAGSLDHMLEAQGAGASAAAAGSLFVFHGRHDAVLITYPGYNKIQKALGGG